MDKPTQEGNTWIYDNVTDEDLKSLLQDGIITVSEFLQLHNEGQLEKENIKIYFTDKKHAGNSRTL